MKPLTVIAFLLFGVAADAAIEEVFLLPMTHLDIGFTQPLDTVAMQSKGNIDQAIAMCEENDDFFWTIESLWELEQWRIRSSDAHIQRLQALIRSGRMEVGAMYCTLRTGLLGLEDANRMLYPMQRTKESLGIPFVTAIQNDVPGYADVYPRVFASGGLRYFLTGTNLGMGGGASIPRSDMPFYWQSADGERILTWIDPDGYVSVWPWGLANIFDRRGNEGPLTGESFLSAIRDLETEGYPYRRFLLLFAMGDNVPPAAHRPFLEKIRAWNQEGRTPRLRFATPRMFFEQLEQELDPSKLKTYRGNWHGLWDARLWNPAGNTLGRFAQQQLPAAELLSSLAALNGHVPYSGYDLREGYNALLCHVEHTCGGDPGWLVPRTRAESERQNELTLRYAQDAYFAAARVEDVSLNHLLGRLALDQPSLFVFNPLQWGRSEPVTCRVPRHLLGKPFDVRDPILKQSVPYELDSERSLLRFFARDLPGFGYKRYTISQVKESSRPATDTETLSDAPVIENEYYRIEVNPRQGNIERILDKEANRELVEAGGRYPFGGLSAVGHRQIFTGGEGTDERFPCQIENRSGKDFKRLVIRREGSVWPRSTLELPGGIKRIDIAETLDRDKMPGVAEDEHSTFYSFVFSFALPDDGFEVMVDGPDGPYRYPNDYLPGADLGAIQCQYGIHLQEGTRYGITVANRQAFNWCLGEVNFHRRLSDSQPTPPTRWGKVDANWAPLGGWGKSVRPLRARLFSSVVQHMTEGSSSDQGSPTKYRETEPGAEALKVFEYSLTTRAGPFDASRMTQFCREAVVSPLGRYEDRSFGPRKGEPDVPRFGFFTVQPDTVLVTAVKQAEFGSAGDYIVRFKEVAGRETAVSLTSAFPIENARLTAINEVSDSRGTFLSVSPVKFSIRPYAVQTLRLTFRQPPESVAPKVLPGASE